jgi:ribosomal protein S18 acetylase RimI-like enzyme
MIMDYIVKTEKENEALSEIIKGWGYDFFVSRGKVHKAQDLDGILAYDNKKIIGLGLYYIKNNECEIVLMETFDQNKGIGTKIIDKIINIAKQNKCNRIWLITTNDNINAIKFYQKRGFCIVNIHINAIVESRKIILMHQQNSLNIPLIGEYGIPVRDEIEFEIRF